MAEVKMKSLLFLAAILSSLSTLSQNLIEYQDFRFYQDGVEISFEEVELLTASYSVAKADFRQGRRDYAASQSISRARGRNLINGSIAYTSGMVAGLAFLTGFYWENADYFNDQNNLIFSFTAYTSAAVLAYISSRHTALLATKRKFKRRADRKFMETTEKLNVAIQEEASK